MRPIRQVRDADVVVLEWPGAPSPPDALRRLEGLPGRVLLHSARGGRYSFVGADPVHVLEGDVGVEPGFDPFAELEAALERFALPAPPTSIPFAGGIVGYLGYEAGDVLERLPPPAPMEDDVPTTWFGVYDRALVWDHRSGTCRAVGPIRPGRSEAEVRASLEALVERCADPVRASDRVERRRAEGNRGPSSEIRSSLDREGYEEGVRRIREYIRAGDLFQANLTRRISVATDATGEELFHRLLAESPAAYSAYLDTGRGEVASISPELFLSVRGREVVTRPIKGTAPRGRTLERDRRSIARLQASEKDRAENVMIVDLLRNDLSRIARTGSVQVPELAELETHPTVHHLVSTVRATLVDGAGPVDLLRATFPGGSITGAPKIRAMEILRELEPVRRGVYTGGLGIFGFQGDLDLSIAIRTATVEGGRAHYGTGGGITLASRPTEEWDETEAKARAFLRALAGDD